MHPFIGSGPYCYANSLAMALGSAAPSPSIIEVLTGSPFGMHLLGGRLPLFNPYGWDDRGIDDAIALLGWTGRRRGAEDGEQALAMLAEAVKSGPVVAGPLEMGLLRHVPGMTGPIGSDHFVAVLEADDTVVRFHDPYGCPYATLPTQDFLAAWRADTITFYDAEPYTMRGDFQQIREITTEAAVIATRQARLVGSLQYDLVNGHSESVARTLRQLAPTYNQLAAVLI